MARKTQPVPKSFEDAMGELEKILGDLEGGSVTLEESLVRYERGTYLIQHCRDALQAAEKQIELIGRGDEDGDKTKPPADPSVEPG